MTARSSWILNRVTMFHPSPLIDQNRIDAELEMESLPKIELR